MKGVSEEYRRKFIHRLRKRKIEDVLKNYELLNNTLCKTILQNAKSNIISEFTLQELGDVLKELKRSKCKCKLKERCLSMGDRC